MGQRILVVVAHPYLEFSRVSASLLQAVRELSFVTIHRLYDHYPDFFIDVEHEQSLLASHDVIVLQHPFYWYSCPALLKEWLDSVLQGGFAFGPGGNFLTGKKMLSVVSVGGNVGSYTDQGLNGYSVEQFLLPFVQTARFCGMEYLAPYVIFGGQRHSGQLEQAAQGYRQLFQTLHDDDPAEDTP
jgi:glutathione-regulated potassium-efflux system ancillary protein KefG